MPTAASSRPGPRTGETTCSYDDDGQLLSDELDGLGVVHRFEMGSIAESVYLGKFAVWYDLEEDGSPLDR